MIAKESNEPTTTTTEQKYHQNFIINEALKNNFV